MRHFGNYDELIEAMYDEAYENEEGLATVVADADFTKELVKRIILDNPEINIGILDFDEFDYDGVMHTELQYDEEVDTFEVSVVKGQREDDGLGLATDGYVLFHSSVDEKILADMLGNEYTDFYYDVFDMDCVCVLTDEDGNLKGFHKCGDEEIVFACEDEDRVKEVAKMFNVELQNELGASM